MTSIPCGDLLTINSGKELNNETKINSTARTTTIQKNNYKRSKINVPVEIEIDPKVIIKCNCSGIDPQKVQRPNCGYHPETRRISERVSNYLTIQQLRNGLYRSQDLNPVIFQRKFDPDCDCDCIRDCKCDY